MLYDSIMQVIGSTPIVRLNNIGSHLPCQLYAKCEFLNPGGSVKDRIAMEMVTHAEKCGRILPGNTLIEATSGNTGIGVALIGALKGYKVIIIMADNMGQEKELILHSLGATVIRTPTSKADDYVNHLELGRRLEKEIPHAYFINQYANKSNPDTHYLHTAQEILDDMGSDLAMVVMSVGTGGTITGVSARLKDKIPNIQIIGVEPYGSILGGDTHAQPYLVEGIGQDFIPEVLNNKWIDQFIKVHDQDSFTMARSLIREEGLLVGESSGTAMWAALQASKNLKKGQKCLVILPDGIRNYMSKFVDNEWMQSNGFNLV